MKELIEETKKELEWAKMTIDDKLTFGMSEEQAIKFRERRVKGVLLTSIRNLEEVLDKLTERESVHKPKKLPTKANFGLFLADYKASKDK